MSSWYAFIRFQENWYSYLGFLDVHIAMFDISNNSEYYSPKPTKQWNIDLHNNTEHGLVANEGVESLRNTASIRDDVFHYHTLKRGTENRISLKLCEFICARLDLVINGSACCIPEFQFQKKIPIQTMYWIEFWKLFSYRTTHLNKATKNSFKLPQTLIEYHHLFHKLSKTKVIKDLIDSP